MAQRQCARRTADGHAVQVQDDGLHGLRRVDHLDDDVARRSVVARRGEEAVLTLLVGHGHADGLLALLPGHGQPQDVGASVGGVHLLHIVARGLEHLGLVVPNLVGAPLPSVDVRKEWGRGRHVDDVGITLEARHVRSLEDGGLVVVPLLAASVAGILAGEDLRPLAVVAVVAQAVGQEPLLVAIIVLVVEVHLQLLHARLQEVEVPALAVGPRGADELQRGVLGADGVAELLQTLGEDGAEAAVLLVVVPLLVTDGKEFQVERLGVAHVGTDLAPRRRGVAVGKLDQV